MCETAWVLYSFCGGHESVGGSLARGLVPILSSLIANEAQYAPDNVGDNEFVRLCFDQLATSLGNVLEECVDVVPF